MTSHDKITPRKVRIEDLWDIEDDPGSYNGGFIAWDEDTEKYEVAFVNEGKLNRACFGSNRNATKWFMEQREQVDESLVGRLLSNACFKLFNKNYIEDWADGSYKWNKTEHSSRNNNIALNTLKDLVAYYSFIGGLNVKQILKAQGNGFFGWLKGFWFNLQNRILGNPKKLEAMVNFNNQMKTKVTQLYQALDNLYATADKYKGQGLGIPGDDDFGGVSESTSWDELIVEADEAPAPEGTDGKPAETPAAETKPGESPNPKNPGEEGGKEEKDEISDEDVKKLAEEIKKYFNSFDGLFDKISDETVKKDLTNIRDDIGHDENKLAQEFKTEPKDAFQKTLNGLPAATTKIEEIAKNPDSALAIAKKIIEADKAMTNKDNIKDRFRTLVNTVSKASNNAADAGAPNDEETAKIKQDVGAAFDDLKENLDNFINSITNRNVKAIVSQDINKIFASKDAECEKIAKGSKEDVAAKQELISQASVGAGDCSSNETYMNALIAKLQDPASPITTMDQLLEALSNMDETASSVSTEAGLGQQVQQTYIEALKKIEAAADDSVKANITKYLNMAQAADSADMWNSIGNNNYIKLANNFNTYCDNANRVHDYVNILVNADPADTRALINILVQHSTDDNAITGDERKGGAGLGKAASLTEFLSRCNDVTKNEIKWANGKSFTASIKDIYIAENSLYRVVVYLDGFINDLYQGKYYADDGTYEDINLKQVLSGPCGKYITQVRDHVNAISEAIQKSSGFGSLQESAVKQIMEEYEKVLSEHRVVNNMNEHRSINEALAKFKKLTSDDVKKEKEIVSEEIILQNDTDEESLREMDDALLRMKRKALDLDGNDLVFEAPEVPAPAAPAAPTAPDQNPEDEAPAADVPMSFQDLGDPNAESPAPEATPPDPNAGGMDATPVDPAAVGMDPAAGADPNAMAGADPNTDPNAAVGDPNAAADAGADPNAAADPTQMNAAGEQPNNPETNKFDIGVDKPVNDDADEIKLTDDEQEQLFTKINLLSKVPDLVNYGKYLYNITPENVDLNDIHYINTLYELSVKLGLLTDEFEGNNLLAKYDKYTFSVLSKNPEKQLNNGDQTGQVGILTEGVKKVKTEDGMDVTIISAPGLIMAKGIDDYMDQKKANDADKNDNIDETLDDFDQEGLSGLGWLVTFSAVLFGYPRIKTVYVKKQGTTSAKKLAIEQLTKEGYKDIRILGIEEVDPVEMLSREYTGMRRIEDDYTEKYIKSLLKESTQVGIPVSMETDIETCIDLLNQEIMDNPEIDFADDIGITKYPVKMDDLEEYVVPKQVNEEGDDTDSCTFAIRKGDGILSKMFFGSNCRPLCKILQEMASTCDLTLEAVGNDDVIELTFRR